MNEENIIVGKFKKFKHFGFIIPKNREEYGGDFFVTKHNWKDAEDEDNVEGRILKKTKGKKPEAKVLKVITNTKVNKFEKEIIEGIYSGGAGDFGFIDVEGEEKGYFVYGLKKNGATDGDRVKAEVKMYNGKKEAKVFEILGSEEKIITGVYQDSESFGFVLPDDKTEDIFIAGSRKAEAKNGDRVEVAIIKKGIGKRSEGIIKKIITD